MNLEDEGQENAEQAEVEEPHRALIFCKMQSYLSVVIECVLEPYKIKYTQMTSNLSGQERYEAVEQFNSDTSIKVMIMTTTVGGLGLNLTGADTVIFMEHDWNPMKDMQAIDRAHRIGQKRIVNVYRLILLNTLEEKIMSLQQFKKDLAHSLIERQKDLTLQDAEHMQLNDLLECFEEHTVYAQTTAQDQKPKAQAKKPALPAFQPHILAELGADLDADNLEFK